MNIELQKLNQKILKINKRIEELDDFIYLEQTKPNANYLKITESMDEIEELKFTVTGMAYVYKKRELRLFNPYYQVTPTEKYVEDILINESVEHNNIRNYVDYD